MKFQNKELQACFQEGMSAIDLAREFDKILSDQKKISSHFKSEFERLNVIIDLVPNTLSWVNRDMTYFGVNKALADTCNVTPEEFVGKTIGFHTKERFFYEFVTELFRSPNDTIYKELDARIAGVDRVYLVSGTKLQDKDKAVVIGMDITELSKLKDHVSFTQKLANLGEMFAGIIHDINNPLMMIESSAKKVKKLIDNEEAIEILNKIEMSSQKISKIVKGIKVYIGQEGGGSALVRENLGSIVDDALTICENQLKDKMVAVVLDPVIYKINIPCHYTQIFQVFVNLISNSIDAISPLPEKLIEIMCEDQPEHVIIRFSDSGSGIPKEHQEKIFNAFFTTKERGVGSGLGLSLCRKILEAHGGELTIDSKVANTTFLMKFKK